MNLLVVTTSAVAEWTGPIIQLGLGAAAYLLLMKYIVPEMREHREEMKAIRAAMDRSNRVNLLLVFSFGSKIHQEQGKVIEAEISIADHEREQKNREK